MKSVSAHDAVDSVSKTRNFARYCVENPHIAWVLLIGMVLWGVYGYTHMPQRKDPDVPLKMAMVQTPWPGASAEKVEELVTKTIENVIASNSKIAKIESISRSGNSMIILSVSDDLSDAGQGWTITAAGWRASATCRMARVRSTTSATLVTPRH